MTVIELRDELNFLIAAGSGDLEIRKQCASGDYWHTQLALEFQEPEEMKIVYTDYHSNHKIVDDEDVRKYHTKDEVKTVFII